MEILHGLSKISRKIPKAYIANSFVHSILEYICSQIMVYKE